MGLVFALQPDVRRSRPETLVLKSSKRRFSLGGGLLFAGALLATMYFAAAPLFKVLFSDGTFLDQALVGFIYASIYGYPLIALFCWFYEEVLIVSRRPDGKLDAKGWTQLLGVKWHRKQAEGFGPGELRVENWKGAVNVAAIDAKRAGRADRYATKGHWMLVAPGAGRGEVLEKRAKVDDIELVRAQIQAFFGYEPVATAAGSTAQNVAADAALSVAPAEAPSLNSPAPKTPTPPGSL